MATLRERRIWVRIVGAIVGLAIGAIVSINIVIYGGIDRGYEASPAEVFHQNPLVGVLAAAALAAGPFIGAYVAGRIAGKP